MCQRMLGDQQTGKLQFLQRPTVMAGRRSRTQGKAHCPLFLDFRENGVGL